MAARMHGTSDIALCLIKSLSIDNLHITPNADDSYDIGLYDCNNDFFNINIKQDAVKVLYLKYDQYCNFYPHKDITSWSFNLSDPDLVSKFGALVKGKLNVS